MPETGSAARPAVTPTLPAANTTVGVVLRQAEQWGTRPALYFFADGEWRNLSWERLGKAITRVATGLIRLGVEPGDRVVLLGENSAHWIVSDYAVQLTGAISVPIYPTLTHAEACDIARDCGARLAIVSGALAGALEGVAIKTIAFEDEIATWVTGRDEQPDDALAGRVGRLRGTDLATVIYTSGTTGRPKGVMLSHEGITTMAATGAKAFRLTSDDVLLSFLPYSHVFERVEGIMAPLSAGATIWISRGATELAKDLAVARPTMLLLVPRVLEKIMTAIEDGVRRRGLPARFVFRVSRSSRRIAAVTLASLRSRISGGRLRLMVSGGAPLRGDVERFFWSIGLPVYQGWGLTESTAAVTANRPGAIRHGTVGRPLEGVEVRADQDGELLVKGPGVMRGYYGKPDETAPILVDGWLRTGDIGSIDHAGYVRITDRKKDLIKTSTGKYVAPQPLEAELQRFRYIAAAVLIGDRRPYIVALVQPNWDEVRRALNLEEPSAVLANDGRVQEMIRRAIETINGRLAGFETIKRFRVIAGEFTEANGVLTPSLKVRRRVVEQRYQRLIDEMYRASPS